MCSNVFFYLPFGPGDCSIAVNPAAILSFSVSLPTAAFQMRSTKLLLRVAAIKANISIVLRLIVDQIAQFASLLFEYPLELMANDLQVMVYLISTKSPSEVSI